MSHRELLRLQRENVGRRVYKGYRKKPLVHMFSQKRFSSIDHYTASRRMCAQRQIIPNSCCQARAFDSGFAKACKHLGSLSSAKPCLKPIFVAACQKIAQTFLEVPGSGLFPKFPLWVWLNQSLQATSIKIPRRSKTTDADSQRL